MRKTRRAVLGGVLAAAAIPMTIALTASPAAAHYAYVYHGSDLASVSSDHARTSVCDREADGHYVWGDYVYNGGRTTSYYVTFSGCGTLSLPGITRFRLCEQSEGCTAWKNA